MYSGIVDLSRIKQYLAKVHSLAGTESERYPYVIAFAIDGHRTDVVRLGYDSGSRLTKNLEDVCGADTELCEELAHFKREIVSYAPGRR